MFIKEGQAKTGKIIYSPLCDAVAIGDIEGVKQALLNGNEPKEHINRVLRLATENGHIEIVKLLIPVSNPKDNNSSALGRAVINGDVECLKLLIPVSNISNMDLVNAASLGHTECIRLLIP